LGVKVIKVAPKDGITQNSTATAEPPPEKPEEEEAESFFDRLFK
jgi:hypothetical protein